MKLTILKTQKICPDEPILETSLFSVVFEVDAFSQFQEIP